MTLAPETGKKSRVGAWGWTLVGEGDPGIYTMEYYSVMRKEDSLPFETTWGHKESDTTEQLNCLRQREWTMSTVY